MKFAFVGALLLPLAWGQTVSFAPQGAAVLKALTGKRIAGVGIADVVVCSPSGLPIPSGVVYQTLVRNGISPIRPESAKALFNRTVALNWRNLVLEGAADASIGIPVLGQSGVIKMTTKWVVAILAGHAVIDSLSNQARAHMPDPSPVLSSLLDPGDVLTFAGAATGCHESSVIIRFNRDTKPGIFVIQ
jgi:hypothetical protein